MKPISWPTITLGLPGMAMVLLESEKKGMMMPIRAARAPPPTQDCTEVQPQPMMEREMVDS